MKITLQDEISELQRELGVRKRVYPDWIKFEKIQSKTANYRILVIEKILERLRNLQHKNEPKTLFEQ